MQIHSRTHYHLYKCNKLIVINKLGIWSRRILAEAESYELESIWSQCGMWSVDGEKRRVKLNVLIMNLNKNDLIAIVNSIREIFIGKASKGVAINEKSHFRPSFISFAFLHCTRRNNFQKFMPMRERRRFALNAFSEKSFINKTGGKVGKRQRRGSKGEIFDGIIAMNSFRLQPFCARLYFSLFFLKFWRGPVKMKFIWIAFFIAALNFSSFAWLACWLKIWFSPNFLEE